MVGEWKGAPPGNSRRRCGRVSRAAGLVAMSLSLLIAAPSQAQPAHGAAELERLVAPVALYPDPLLAQVLAASTYPDQLTAASHWANAHRDLTGESLAAAMRSGALAWDPTVQALLPFPSLLERMASDADWSTALGDAFLERQQDVLQAVQRLRDRAETLDYLRSDGHVTVKCDPCSIAPRNPAYIFVPSYDPDVVFAVPADASAQRGIRFDSEVNVGGFEPFGYASTKFEVLGGYFQAWGWGRGGIDWAIPGVVINHVAWRRTAANRADYVHPYPDLPRSPSATAQPSS